MSGIAATQELHPGTEFTAIGCYARMNTDELVIGNSHVQRKWRIADGQLFAVSFLDADQQRQWMDSPSNLPSPESRHTRSDGRVILKGASGIFGPTEAESLRIELEESTTDSVVTYEFQVFPKASGIQMWLTQQHAGSDHAASRIPLVGRSFGSEQKAMP